MGLKKIGSLWKPKSGGKSVASGYIDFLGQQIRVVITYSKYAGQKQGNNDFNIMADDGKGDRNQGQGGSGGSYEGGGYQNSQPPAQPAPEGFGGGGGSPPPAQPNPQGFSGGGGSPPTGNAPEPWE